jgi:CubicO group peptidase (beta-lactamase class C family)
MDIEEYAARNLFAPLGITQWHWKRAPNGLIDTEGGLYLEARDLAKIWYVFLENGRWDGRQVVSPDWVKRSVAPAIAVAVVPNAPKYGLKWWLYPDPRDSTRLIWGGSGFGGQVPMTFHRTTWSSCSTAGTSCPADPGRPAAR